MPQAISHKDERRIPNWKLIPFIIHTFSNPSIIFLMILPKEKNNNKKCKRNAPVLSSMINYKEQVIYINSKLITSQKRNDYNNY